MNRTFIPFCIVVYIAPSDAVTTLSGLVTRQSWGSSNSIEFIYDESSQPFAMRYNGTLYYYVLNIQGDVVGLMNTSGTLVATYTYDPWGKLISSTGTLASVNPLRYRGYYYDNETGFYYLQSRYYDPAIGRFINADTYATTDADNPRSTNMFAYCENDPVNRCDPTGEIPQFLVGAAVGAGLELGMQLLTGTKLADVNWKDVAAQGVVGALASWTVPEKIVSKVVRTAISIAKDIGAPIVAECFSQHNSNSKNAGKTAAVGTQAVIDKLVDKGADYLTSSTEAKVAKAVVRTVQYTFSFTFGFTIETLFRGSSPR